jgi:hypothetical protein
MAICRARDAWHPTKPRAMSNLVVKTSALWGLLPWSVSSWLDRRIALYCGKTAGKSWLSNGRPVNYYIWLNLPLWLSDPIYPHITFPSMPPTLKTASCHSRGRILPMRGYEKRSKNVTEGIFLNIWSFQCFWRSQEDRTEVRTCIFPWRDLNPSTISQQCSVSPSLFGSEKCLSLLLNNEY